jgi:predicted nucleotidyltransferase
MAQYGWADCPADVRAAVEAFVGEITAVLGPFFVGVYLHGSLAMNCFNPKRSDIDLLVVTHEGMDVDTKRRVAKALLQRSTAPFPIEISFVRWDDLHPWQYPTTFDFHYSEDWREQTANDLASDAWTHWNDRHHQDPDLAAHITITLGRGSALVGPPPREVFPAVPPDDYLASICGDVEKAEQSIDEDVVYVTLNLCRVYAYVRDGLVCSKDEGGIWALSIVPPAYRPLVEQALEAYRGERADGDINVQDAGVFARAILQEIERRRWW